MRIFKLLVLFLFVSLYATAQTTVFTEDFEGTPPYNLTSSSPGTADWAISSHYQSGGLYSDTSVVVQGDTAYLTSNSFSTTGNLFVLLEFSHICKISIFDAAEVEISINGGTTWTKLSGNEYLGSSQFVVQGNRFTGGSYTLWEPSNATTIDNGWWQRESFDISAIAGDQADVRVRFVLRDGNNQGAQNFPGWFIDDIEVTAALDEMIPPTIQITNNPVFQDTVYTTGPFEIKADITDASGIDSAILSYTINNGAVVDSIMTRVGGNSFKTTIPSVNIDDSVCYSIYAVDSSLIQNSSTYPASSCIKFYVKTSPPPPGCTSPVTTFPIVEDMESFTVGTPGTIGNGWTRNSSGHQWYVHTGSTPDSWSTGPSGDHTTGNGVYIYTEGDMGTTGDTAVFISPCIDLTVMSNPQLKFFYHMRGTSIGSLSVDIYYGGTWQEIWTKTTDQGDFWLEESIDLAYYSSVTQIRFRAIKGSSYSCDLALDDIRIWDVPAINATMSAINEPSGVGIEGEKTAVTVEIINNGSTTISNIPVSYTVNSGTPVNELIGSSLVPGDTITYTFNDSIVIPAGTYDVCAYVYVSGEGFTPDDTLCISPYGLFVSTIPFVTNFESQQYWYQETNNPTSIWEYGTPNYGATNTTHSGTKAWDINLSTAYGISADAYLYTQLFDFSNDTSATLSFWMNYNTESCCDGISLEYSIDTGATWQKLGIQGDPLGVNWYSHSVTAANGACWADNSNGWKKMEYDLSMFDSASTLVQFRYLFGSDGSVQRDGASIDDFSITVPVVDDPGLKTLLRPTGSFPENARVAVEVTVKNFGANTLTEIPLGYQYNGGSIVLDTLFATLNPGDTADFIFADSIDIVSGYAELCAFTRYATDIQNFNDTLCTQLYGIGVLSLPIATDFESGSVFYAQNSAGSNWEYGTPAYGVTTGANSPVNAWDINLTTTYTNSAASYLYTPYIDFSTTQEATLSFWMNFYTESCCDGFALQYSIDTGSTWQTLGNQGDPLGVNWYTHNIFSVGSDCWADNSNGWIKAEYDLSQFDSVPIVQFRFFFGSDGSVTYDGVSIDDFSIIPAAEYDLSPVSIMSPGIASPEAANVPVKIKVRNNGLLAVDTIPVGYAVNGGTVIIDTIFSTLNPGDTVQFTFADSIITPAGAYNICVFTLHSLDTYTFNDTICKTSTGVTTQTLPYSDDFESTVYWFENSSPGSLWELGTPNFGVTDTAYSPVNSWDINLSSAYSNDALSYLYSPYFDFSTANDYTLEFWKNMNLSSDDGMYIQYSVDTGQTWLTLGSVGDPNGTNWYNDNSLGNGQPGFSGNNAPWDSSSYQLSALNFEPLVQFRFVFYSNSFTTADGISIDDVSITPPPAYEAEMAELVSPIDGCGLNNTEVVTVKIKNKGTNQINGGINVSYQVLGDPVVTESISTTIDAGDSLNYPFTATIDMSVTTQDSLFNITAWVDLTGDPIQSNDTIVTDVLSGYVPDDPIVNNVTIPYGTSASLLASTTSLVDTSFSWFDVPSGGTALSQDNPFITPILYDTTVYWVETKSGSIDSLGPINPSIGSSASFTAIVQYLLFDILSPNGVTIKSVDIYPTVAAGSAYTIVIKDAASQTIYSYSGTTTVAANNKETILIDTHIPFGTGYKFGFDVNPGMTRNSTGAIYPYTIPNEISITGNTFDPAYYYFFYNWIIGNPTCPSNRVPDTVFVAVSALDAGVIAIDQPNTGIDLTSAETVEVRIKNFGNTAISNFDVSYTVNGVPTTETIANTINPGDTLTYLFTQGANLSSYGAYDLKAYTSLTGDGAAVNDTAYKTVECLPLTYCPSGATSTYDTDIGNVTIANINHGPISPILSNTLANGTYSDYTDSTNLHIYMNPGNTYPISVTQITSGSYFYNASLAVYIDFNRNGDFTDAGEQVLTANSTEIAPTMTGIVNVPASATVGYTRMRVVLQESATAPPDPCGTFSYGETEDYTIIMAPMLAQDAGVIEILQPIPVQSEGNTVDVEVAVKNFGTDTIFAMDIEYIYGTNPTQTYNWSGILPPDSTQNVIIGNETVTNGSNSLCAKTSLTGDSNAFNDEICTNILGLPPMLLLDDDMENGSQLTTTSTLWQRGVPAGTIINSANSPDTAWVTNLSGNYTASANATLSTPQFNFLFVSGAYLSFWHWVNAQEDADGGHIEYSKNGGSTWQYLGSLNDPAGVNWYGSNSSTGPAWTKNTNGWKYAIYDLSILDNSIQPVQFRFIFTSNTDATVSEGWAIDDVKIHVPKFTTDAGVISILSPSGSTTMGTQTPVSVRIKNFGSDTLTSINIGYRINTGYPPQSAIWSGTLAPDSTVDYTFNNQYPGPNQNYTLCAYTQMSQDQNKTNDTTCVNLSYDTGIEEIADNGLILRQNMPNPAAAFTEISYFLPYAGNIRFTVTDVLGNLLFEKDENKGSGNHKLLLQTESFATGVYFYSVEFDNRKLTMKMIVR
jgi:hypothetical protein